MRRLFALSLILWLSTGAWGIELAAPSRGQEKEPLARKQAPETSSGVRPEEVNVFVQTDERLFIVMAALNIAGYDYESSGRDLSPLRKQLRRDLTDMDPNLRARMVDYYKVHLRDGADGPPRVGGYVALGLVMSPPPALSMEARRETLPEDVVAAADFTSLVREFYAKSGVAKLIRPTFQLYKNEIDAAQQQVGAMIFQTLNYLHTLPVLTLTGRFASEKKEAVSQNQKKSGKSHPPSVRQRTRRLFVLLNPLDAADTAYIRNDILNGADTQTERLPGDDYFVVLGSPSNIDPVRLAFLRFVLEPLGEQFARAIQEQAAPIGHLAERVIGTEAARKETTFSIVNESLVRAVEARLKRLQAQGTVEDKLADEDAIYDLSTHYERGAVLVFHFYERLMSWEPVGADLAAYYEEMLRSITFEREAARANVYREVRVRVESRRMARQRAVTSTPPLIEPLRQADVLIQGRQLEQAETLLREILKQHPHNARALYGLAQVVSQVASQIDPTKSPDQDAAWEQLMAQLGQAVQLYRQAIADASPLEEKWLISQAHVAIGKILDFANQREAAVAEYQKAIEIGDVPGGAYAQAKARLKNKN